MRVARLALMVALATSIAAPSAADPAPKKTAAAPKPHPPVARAAKPAKAAPTPAPKYAGYVKKWHTPTPGKEAPLDASGRPMLALYALNSNDRLEIPASSDVGGFSASSLDRAAWLLRETHSGNEHPIEPRLLDVVYRIQTHFHAHEIRVISGYRTPHGRGGSNHGKGRAMDLVVPGATDEEVARFARETGFCGVGVYPVSGFVHVDVRDRSYFWVDSSAPGRRNRERGILGDVAKRADAAAAARGEHGTRPLSIGSDVDLALRALGPLSADAPAADEDDEDGDEE